MNGFLIINKKENMTSTDVVRKVKKEVQIKKVGHSGTLDPMTTGVLVIALNRATKYLSILTKNSEKKYLVTMRFGYQTDTFDVTGEVIKEDNDFKLDMEQFIKTCNMFVGEYEQIPPIYSAKKVDGKRLYEYARAGKQVEIEPSKVIIHSIYNIIKVSDIEVSFEVVVSKGTYIRSLIEDIAQKMNTCATMSKLCRLETDGFNINQAVEIEDISLEKVIGLESYLSNIYPKFYVEGKIKTMIENGVEMNRLSNKQYPLLYVDKNTHELIALYDVKDEIKSKPIFMMGK